MSSNALRRVDPKSAVAFAAGQREVITIFRRMLRSVPYVLTVYDLNIPPAQARKAIADRFRENSNLRDPRAIALQLMKAQQDFDEVLLQYKGPSHLAQMFGFRQKSVFDLLESPDEVVQVEARRRQAESGDLSFGEAKREIGE